MVLIMMELYTAHDKGNITLIVLSNRVLFLE